MVYGAELPPPNLAALLERNCAGCHGKSAQGGLNLKSLPFQLGDRQTRDHWIRIHDRIERGEMPPKGIAMPAAERTAMVKQLAASLRTADQAEMALRGRGPMRRLTREEYEQNLRDVLDLPHLDLRDMLPEDREQHHFNKTSETLDMSRVQLTAYLDATEVALRAALATATAPQVSKFRAVGTALFPSQNSLGIREAMFWTRNNQRVEVTREQFQAAAKTGKHDPTLELAFFRSAGWPYAAYPQRVVAQATGEYRVRFAARAVLQSSGADLKAATQSVPMTFRARKPSNHDIAEDVRAVGGIIDIQPESRVYETTVLLNAGQTIEYGLLGLPTPQVDAIPSIPASYRYPPFPAGGQPGVVFQWLEMEGPLPAPAAHRVLFDEGSRQSKEDAKRLMRRFAERAARGPVAEEALRKFEQLIFARLDKGEPFTEAMLTGYQAFLCSDLFLYLAEPGEDTYALASRLSHFLTNTRPDTALLELARSNKLREARVLRAEAERLIAGPGLERFLKTFPDYWLSLRHVRRDDPDLRLYPEYRLDEYLVDSMDRETRVFLTAMVRDNLPIRTLIEADFVFANDRLAKHYGLPPLHGSALRRVALPKESPLGGLLTQASILKVTANGTTTSPVLRGAWIMDRLIGEPPPPPPPGVPAVEPDIRGAKTIREQLALHTKSTTCASCHAKFDPVGLALENFDIVGAWRTRYRGLEQGERISGIDPSGHDFDYTLAAGIDASGQLSDGRRFKDVRELKALLAANPRQLARNVLHQLTIYATGTPVRFGDRPEIEQMLDACAPAGYRMRDLMLALVQSRIFRGGHS
jgi:hypothetical protein